VEDLPVKKPHQRSVGRGSSVPVGVLAERAAEALRQERFKEAAELFKLAIRQDPRPEWKEALSVAYSGRARTMAAKKMFKEAAMVLENTLAADGTVREPQLYLACLIRDGQQPKAAAYLLRSVGRDGVLASTRRTACTAKPATSRTRRKTSIGCPRKAVAGRAILAGCKQPLRHRPPGDVLGYAIERAG
jgi:hypothetical protein